MYHIQNLSHNLRKYRKIRGLTQAQLADLVYVAAQNVSKWELGTTYPDINNLCKLAEALKVSPDSLLLSKSENDAPKCLLAVDGGGTKTEILLFTEQGQALERLVLAGTNPNSCGMETTLSILKTGIDHMISLGFPIAGIFCGIAGCGNEAHAGKVHSFLTENYPHMQSKVRSDIYNVLYSVEQPENAIAVICGTGSVVYAHTSEDLKQLGGWGYLFDRGGSGYDLGRDAICAALAQREHTGAVTLITDLVEAKIGGSARDNINKLYSAGKDYIASFSSIVFEAHKQGDSLAGEIIEKNADRLSFLINSAAAQYRCGPAVILSGGIVTKQPTFLSALSSRLNPQLEPILCDLPQICGAAANCCRLFADLSSDFRTKLQKSYEILLQKA